MQLRRYTDYNIPDSMLKQVLHSYLCPSVMYLATVDIFHSTLPEEEIDEIRSLKRANKLRLIEPLAVELLRTNGRAADSRQAAGYSWISSREIHGASSEVVPGAGQQCCDVGSGAVGAAGYPSHPLKHTVHILNLHQNNFHLLGSSFPLKSLLLEETLLSQQKYATEHTFLCTCSIKALFCCRLEATNIGKS